MSKAVATTVVFEPTPAFILLLSALTVLAMFATDVYLPALPTLVETMKSTPGEGQLTLSAYFFGLAIGQALYGPLSDRIGRRAPLLIGMSIFVIASLICFSAPNMTVLILGRFAQAFGSCAGIVMARAIVRDCCDSRGSARVYALMAMTISVAPIVAPFCGALYLSIGSWRGLFVALAFLGAMLWIYVFVKFAETRPAEVVLRAQAESWHAAYGALLRNLTLMRCLMGYGLGTSSLFVYITTAPDLLITGFRLSPVQFGYFFAANIMGNVGASALSTRLLRRYTPEVIARYGNTLGLIAAGCLAIAALTGFGQMWGIVIPLFVVMSSLGFTQPNMGAIAMAIDPSRSGAAASMLGALQFTLCASITAVVSLLHDGSARPMALTILLCLAGAWWFFNIKREPPVADNPMQTLAGRY